MVTVCDKSLYDSKILETINHMKNISKKKPAIENIRKYLVEHQLTLEKVLLQVLLDNLIEENNLEIYESNSNEICYNVKKNTDVIEDKHIDTDTESLTAGTPISFHSDTPRKKSSKKNPDIRELFIDNKTDSLHKKDTRYDNFHICHQLNLQQKESIKFQSITIDHLRGELESKQKVLENLLDTLKHCLHSQSTKHDELYFSLQDTNYKFDQKNINNSDIPINSHKEVIPIDKETINDNHEKSKT